MEERRKNSSITNTEFHLLNQIGKDFASSLDFESVIDMIMSRVRDVLKCEASSVILFDETRDSLVFYAASGAGAKEVEGLTIPRGKGFAGWVFDHQEAVVVDDVDKDERFYSGIDKITHMKTMSLICVPVVNQEKKLGVIEGINKIEGSFTERDLELLTAISQLAGISLENSMIHRNLEQKNADLDKLNKEMDDFVNIVSHDLQTPLASIEGYVGLIKDEMSSLFESNEDLKNYLDRIEQNCKNMFHFIGHLRSLVRLNKESLTVQEFDPASVLDEICHLLEDMIHEKNADVIYNSTLHRIRYDRTLFYHILYNLVQNSLKYSAKCRKPIIKIETVEKDSEIHFLIKDNGAGISQDDQEKIFSFYTRGKNAITTDGYGLGLAFVKKIVELFDGKVWVETEPDKGSIFFFSLPK
jgi:K+-sensing histidine kinase KdpD